VGDVLVDGAQELLANLSQLIRHANCQVPTGQSHTCQSECGYPSATRTGEILVTILAHSVMEEGGLNSRKVQTGSPQTRYDTEEKLVM
jgi:hypothetical protein